MAARITALESALRAILDAPQNPKGHAAMAAARQLLGEEGASRDAVATCACGRVATLNGRCMACASREAE
jgi:hypothetical protein